LRWILSALVALAAAMLGFGWWMTEPTPLFSHEEWASFEQGGDATRGRVVFEAGGCASCHATPGQPDRLKLGGGLELKSPFGSFYAPNISPHPQDGIGAWKAVDLANAMLTGVSPAGEHYYPAFPYTSFHNATFGDIRDLLTFLRTLEPVEGKPRGHSLAFPFNIRRGLGLWKLLFFDIRPLKPDPGKSPEWNRGRYLVEGLGHCAECHSPRNVFGAIIVDQRFAGGPNPVGKGAVPNITPDKSGLAAWTEQDIAFLLAQGLTPSGDSVGGAMVEVVRNIAELPDDDRAAIAAYLKSLPPKKSAVKPKSGQLAN
jgi:mono/diheme cytochrome c family protein